MNHHIFLSYSRKDADFMLRLKASFAEANLTVWTDEGIDPGTANWKRAIQGAILDAGCLICVLSPDSAESRWVQEELDFAELQEVPIFLVLVRGDEKTAIPFGFSTHQWVDLRSEANYDNRVSKLIEIIRRRMRPMPAPTTEHDPLATMQLPVDFPPPPDVSAILPPPFAWCYVPKGMVRMAGGGYVPEDGRSYAVGSFYIGKFPVTNAQYARFMSDGAYQRQAFWTGAGWRWRQTNGWHEPEHWQDPRFNHNDHPVVGVSWYEAVAFVRWLNLRLHHQQKRENQPQFTGSLRLPTEHQWQLAAQGEEGREFPWGDDWDVQRCNTGRTGTNRVTDFDGVNNSPYGVVDLAGNVWDWCLTQYKTGRNDITTAGEPRIWRGGSWSDDISFARTKMRLHDQPHMRFNDVGFRITCVFRPTTTE